MLKAVANTVITVVATIIVLTFDDEFSTVSSFAGLGFAALFLHGIAEWIGAGWYKEQAEKIAADRVVAREERATAKSTHDAAVATEASARKIESEALAALAVNKPLQRSQFKAGWLKRRYKAAVAVLAGQGKYLLDENGNLMLRDIPSHLRVEDIGAEPEEIEYPPELR